MIRLTLVLTLDQEDVDAAKRWWKSCGFSSDSDEGKIFAQAVVNGVGSPEIVRVVVG